MRASFLDTITRLIYFKEKYQPRKYIIKYVEAQQNQEDFIKAFKECVDFVLGEDSIAFTMNVTDKEINEDLEHKNKLIKAQFIALNRWCNLKEEYKTEIETYLKAKGLDWIIEGIKNP